MRAYHYDPGRQRAVQVGGHVRNKPLVLDTRGCVVQICREKHCATKFREWAHRILHATQEPSQAEMLLPLNEGQPSKIFRGGDPDCWCSEHQTRILRRTRVNSRVISGVVQVGARREARRGGSLWCRVPRLVRGKGVAQAVILDLVIPYTQCAPSAQMHHLPLGRTRHAALWHRCTL